MNYPTVRDLNGSFWFGLWVSWGFVGLVFFKHRNDNSKKSSLSSVKISSTEKV